MPIVSFPTAGEVGLVFDIAPAELKPQAWNFGQNVRFVDGSVESVRGDAILDIFTEETPIWAFPLAESVYSSVAWVLLSTAKVYVWYEETVYDLTRVSGDYTGDSYDRWSGGSLGGLLFINNGVDVPQVWTELNPLTPLIDLAYWPANTTAACLRSFKNFLIALDVTKVAGRFRTMVKWSHPADPGLVPPSWDETDTTKDAGEYSLTETAGACIDAVPLKDILVIYKEDSVWGMQFIGGGFIFRFYKMFGTFGMPQRDCAVEFQPGQHIVFTGDDLILHDGNTSQSLADQRVRTMLREVTIEQLAGCYMVNYTARHEVWFCFRRSADGQPYADTALTYDWVGKTFGLRTLADFYCVMPGRLPPQTLVWLEATYPWSLGTAEWDALQKTASIPRLFALGQNQKYWVDVTSLQTQQVQIERTFIGIAMRAQQPPDLSSRKFLTKLWPRILGTAGEVVMVTLGVVEAPDQAVVWKAPKQYIIGTTKHLDYTASGKMFALRLSSLNAHNWRFSGADAEVMFLGGN